MPDAATPPHLKLSILGDSVTQCPGIGYDVKLLRESDASDATDDEKAVVAIEPPLPPGCMTTIWGDDERYKEQYWSRFPGAYFAGDGARRDIDGYFWLLGRVDDVMNVSGHRISTTEVESALVSHPMIAEAAVVGASDDTTGQGIVAFVILRAHEHQGPGLAKELRDHVAKEIGAIAKPRQILVVSELPKTRSGKIMRRLLRDVAEQRPQRMCRADLLVAQRSDDDRSAAGDAAEEEAEEVVALRSCQWHRSRIEILRQTKLYNLVKDEIFLG